MKRKILVTSLLVATLLSACGDSDNKQNTNQANTAQQAQTSQPANSANPNAQSIKVGTDATYPPFEYRDEKSNVLGIEMDLLNAIGKSQGLNMEFNHFLRKEYHNTLKNGNFDMWASAFYGNAEYPEDVVATKPFMEAYIAVGLCDEKEGNKNIQSIAQLNGKKLAVSKYYGQAMIDLAAKLTGSPDNVEVFDTFYLSAKELYEKKVDGVLGANYVLAYYAKEMKKEETTRFLRVASEEPRRLVFLVNKNNPELLDKLNKGIDAAQADGTIQALQNKWLTGLKPIQ